MSEPEVDTGYTAEDIPGHGRVYNAVTKEVHTVDTVDLDKGSVVTEHPTRGLEMYAPKHLVPLQDIDLNVVFEALGELRRRGYDPGATLKQVPELFKKCEEIMEKYIVSTLDIEDLIDILEEMGRDPRS